MKTESSGVGNLGIVIVAYDHAETLPGLLRALTREKQKGDYIVVVDNHPDQRCAAIARRFSAVDKVFQSENIGFGAGCNFGVSKLPRRIDTYFFINPDVVPEATAITKLRMGADRRWAAWMGLLMLPDGTINSAGNVVHLSGLSWCGQFGERPTRSMAPHEVTYLSGACLMVRRSAWEEAGGFAEQYFLYYEDTDLSMTLYKLGYIQGIVPLARFTHVYAFQRGSYKWYFLERNRYIFILRHWPFWVLIGCLPVFFVSELGLWIMSIKQRRFLVRLRSVVSFLGILPSVLWSRWRRKRSSPVKRTAILPVLTPQLSSPLFKGVAGLAIVDALFTYYYRFLQLFRVYQQQNVDGHR